MLATTCQMRSRGAASDALSFALVGKWLLLFLLTPLVEMYILIEVGAGIGAWPTVGLVTLTAVVGIALLKRQGFETLTRAGVRLAGGELPAQEVAEGLLLAIAGALLVTPGFVTDAIGFSLLAPVVRARLAKLLLARVVRPADGAWMHGRTFDNDAPPR